MNNLLNPFYQKVLGSFLRAGLMLLVPVAISLGVWTPDEATARIGAVSGALAALILSVIDKYSSQKMIVTMQTMPKGSTQAEAAEKIKTEPTPPVTLPKTEAPK